MKRARPYKLAIAVEVSKHPRNHEHYKIWYLDMNQFGRPSRIVQISKDELIEDLFKQIKSVGSGRWRCFLKGEEASRPIELTDFISKNEFENTHFGNLPTISEFQSILDQIELSLTFQACA